MKNETNTRALRNKSPLCVQGAVLGLSQPVSVAVDRGHLDRRDHGRLAPPTWEPSKGKTPRFFAFEPAGNFVYVANEDSDSIVNFRVDKASGRLTPTGDEVKTGSPVCIVFTASG